MTNAMLMLAGALMGTAVGAAIVLVVMYRRRRADAELSERTLEQLKTWFSALSHDAMTANRSELASLTDRQLERGEKTLEEKKKLIDARLEVMDTRLGELNAFLQSASEQHAEQFGSVKSLVETASKATRQLNDTTSQLHAALANPQRRGQWGERMAEDVLRLAGFVEGVNYRKQQHVAVGSRPDYTFLLPNERIVHMDVKFSLENYMKALDAPDDATRANHTKQFLRDVRNRVKEVTTRDYIDPASGTVDYVLVFIPNEQVYGFIHQQDATILDDALKTKVVLCSPLTLYAILAVIRQAMDNFRMEQHARQILELLDAFKKQWGKYVETMDSMGKRLQDAVGKYEELAGVRTKQLDRQFDRIESLRSKDGSPSLPADVSASSTTILGEPGAKP